MKIRERIIWMMAVIALAAMLYHQKRPLVTNAATPIFQVASGADKPCVRITHRYNPTTGKLEPVAENDPLGIR